MKVFRLLIATILLLTTTTTYAQESKWSLRIKGGLGLTNMYIDKDSRIDTEIKAGYQAGAFIDYALPSNLYLQSGLVIQTKGAKFNKDAAFLQYPGANWDGIYHVPDGGIDNIIRSKVTVNTIYLHLPLHIGYRFNLSDDLGINFSAGPYAAYGVAGKTTFEKAYSSGIVKKDKKNTFDNRTWRRFDSGISTQLGVEVQRLSFTLGYEFGLLNISRDNDIFNRNLYFNIGYKVL